MLASPRFQDWIARGAVAAVALAGSVSGLANGFVQDDGVLIADNALIHHLGNWREILASPYWPPPWSPDLYRPIMALLLSLEYALGGGTALLFRISSYLLYAATSVAIFSLGKRLLPRGIALGSALLFAAHPVHVEAVALGVGQNELLVGLLALLMTSRYLEVRRAGSGMLRLGDWALLGSLYVCASLLKEQGLVLPGLLLLAELFLLPGPPRPRIRQLGPGYGLLVALGVLVLLLRRAVLSGNIVGTFTADALQGLGLGSRVLTMLQVVPEWFRLLLWPARLQADYSPQELATATSLSASAALGLALLLGAAAVAWRKRRRAPVCSFGLAWMGVTLLPVSNVLIPTGILLAERTLFLPSMGLVVAAGGLLAAAKRGEGQFPVWRRRALTVGCVVLVLTGVLRSAARHSVWRDETVFTIQSVQDAPRSWRTQKAYGFTLFQQGQREEGIEAYERAIALAPPNLVWRARNDLARRFFEEGSNQLAVAQLRESLTETPDEAETRQYLVLAYLALGAYQQAAAEADSALAHGGGIEVFGGLRALADSAERAKAPPGSIRIRVRGPNQ